MTRARDVATQGGLVLITSQTVSSASTIDVTSCFSSTYDNYLLHWSFSGSSQNLAIRIRMLSGSTPETGSNYANAWAGYNSGGGTGNGYAGIQSYFEVNEMISGSPTESATRLDIIGPNLAARTKVLMQSSNSNGTDYFVRQGSGTHNLLTAYDGFRLYPSAGTFSGTLRLYGYRK